MSFHEAAAFAEWSGARLPTEFEWEHAMVETGARDHPRATDLTTLEPRGEEEATPFADAFGSVWQWTRSAYEPYPGFRVPKGAIGEYNGKFMCGQQVLRGSSSATTPGHSRVTYRNFFYAADRWQMTGLRLARDV